MYYRWLNTCIFNQWYYASKFNEIQYLDIPLGLMFEKVQRDDHFWKINKEPKLKIFYNESLLKNVIKEELRILINVN